MACSLGSGLCVGCCRGGEYLGIRVCLISHECKCVHVCALVRVYVCLSVNNARRLCVVSSLIARLNGSAICLYAYLAA